MIITPCVSGLKGCICFLLAAYWFSLVYKKEKHYPETKTFVLLTAHLDAKKARRRRRIKLSLLLSLLFLSFLFIFLIKAHHQFPSTNFFFSLRLQKSSIKHFHCSAVCEIHDSISSYSAKVVLDIGIRYIGPFLNIVWFSCQIWRRALWECYLIPAKATDTWHWFPQT